VIYYKLKRVNALLYHYASAKGWSIIKRETHPLKSIWASSIISKRIADHKLEVFCEADTLLNTKILTIITVDNVFLKVPVLVGKDIINNNIVPRSLQFRTPMRVPSRLIRTGDSGFDKKLRLYSRDREYALGVIRDDIKKLLVSLDLNVYLGKDKTIVGWEGHPKTSGELNGKISIITEIVKGISKIGGSR